MSVFNIVISKLTEFCLSNVVDIVILSLTVLILTLLLLTFIISVISKKVVEYSAFKYLITALILVNTTLSVIEFIVKTNTFKSVASLIVFNVIIIAISIIFASILTVVSSVKSNKKIVSQDSGSEQASEVEKDVTLPTDTQREVIRVKCVNPTAYGGEYDGFLDVAYLKSLLSLLRQKQLTEIDSNELDEFEVYLMNFASRQPYRSERIKLSGYLSDFMKKLARYDVC